MPAVTRFVAALLLLGPLARPAPVAAQQAVQGGPLRKSDLIRMLVTGVPTKAAIAARIRLNCLSFAPSERDLTDIRLAGADSLVLSAITGCRRGSSPERSTQALQPPTGSPPPAAGLWIRAPVALRAYTGTQITVTAQAFRGTVPQPDISLEVRGAPFPGA